MKLIWSLIWVGLSSTLFFPTALRAALSICICTKNCELHRCLSNTPGWGGEQGGFLIYLPQMTRIIYFSSVLCAPSPSSLNVTQIKNFILFFKLSRCLPIFERMYAEGPVHHLTVLT
ncbi:hypothetical protein CPB84DRAFT_166183 [Gymnopilus junonius]|uniref:Secreted protein n=1 Tax=Gymnopilus junonius TaxID=109634 RepID=A0A9P5NXE4_GYMJU|nr:hypothetical protein CPB84DRAFT_166183 [Gymnopilus junonius]